MNNDNDQRWSHLKYNSIFTNRVSLLLEDQDFIDNLARYAEVYESLLERSAYFKRGIFNHNNADKVAKNLSDNGFFNANHTVSLFREGGYISASSFDELIYIIESEKNRLIEDPELKTAFEALDKKLKANKELREFRRYLSANLEILPELNNVPAFKQKLWISYLQDNRDAYNDLMSEYESGKSRIDQIVEAAKAERTKWEAVVNIFNQRFNVPFILRIENQEDGAQFIPVPLQKAHLIRFCMTTSQRLDSTAPRKKYNFSTVAISQNVEVFL